MIEKNQMLPNELIYNYFASLVNAFFKILPIKENGDSSLTKYVESLQAELMGNGKLIYSINYDSRYMTLLGILQNLIDNPNYPIKKTKRDVFRAIDICNGLRSKYSKQEGVL